MLPWIILATFGRISGSCMASVVQKRLYLAGVSSTAIVSISMSLVAGIALCLSPPRFAIIADLPTAFWILMVASALLDTIGNVLLVRSVGAGELSVVGPLNSYKPLIATVLGVILFREVPSLWGVVGIVMILIGSWLLLQKSNAAGEAASKNARQAIVIRLGSIVLTSVASLFLKSAIERSDTWLAFQFWAVFSAAIAWIVLGVRGFPNTTSRFIELKRTANVAKTSLVFEFLVLCVSLLVMQSLTVWLFAQMPVGYALALFQLASLVQVGLGKKLFSEQHSRQRLIAASVMTAGAMLVLLSS
jgi:drug/metabolite transporter (DMT)-like permease